MSLILDSLADGIERRRPQEWHAEAWRLREGGMPTMRIANVLGRAETTVRELFFKPRAARAAVAAVRAEWHDEAQRLRAQGLNFKAIAERLKRHPSTVRWALNENHQREKVRALERARRARDRETARANPVEPRRGSYLSESDFTRRWVSRPPRQVIAAPDAIRAAALAFARGEIDRAELSRRLRP